MIFKTKHYKTHSQLIMNFVFILLAFTISAQTTQQNIRYDNFIYDPYIKSVRLNNPQFEFSLPIIELNTSQQLILTFDDLRGDYKQYKYTIELCDANWQAVPLSPMEYIHGLHTDDIVQYRFSGNTRKPYVNYSLTFPNEFLKPTLPGNYILKVWNEDSGEKTIILTKRFFVMDPKVSIDASITAGTHLETRWYKQEVDFFIDLQNTHIVNPLTNIIVWVVQNGRWNNALTRLKPRLVRGNILDYNYDGDNSFDGGNEFRSFDIKSMKYRTMEVDGIQLIDGDYHVFLTPDVKRNFLKYTQKSDINGRYVVKTDDFSDSEVNADYVYVHFSLLSDAPRTDGDVYISGEFTMHQLTDEYKMKYNYKRKAYELTLLLKQGYYNYEYVFLPQGFVVGDYSEVEGRHFATENEYSIWVYYRQPGEFFDRLIGLKFLNSRN
jgi:hypothetical protein